VSDFLTEEMNLSWTEAAQLLRETYRAQVGSVGHAPRHTPGRDLWAEFQQWRAAYRDGLRRAWDEQTRHEKDRRGTIKAAFYRARSRSGVSNCRPRAWRDSRSRLRCAIGS
jgi:hypothetical protein